MRTTASTPVKDPCRSGSSSSLGRVSAFHVRAQSVLGGALLRRRPTHERRTAASEMIVAG